MIVLMYIFFRTIHVSMMLMFSQMYSNVEKKHCWHGSLVNSEIHSNIIAVLTGFHWLIASFWLVSQQTDIIRSPGHWRLFNCILGALHVFFFLNVKEGPCRFRMTAFYVVGLSRVFSCWKHPRKFTLGYWPDTFIH